MSRKWSRRKFIGATAVASVAATAACTPGESPTESKASAQPAPIAALTSHPEKPLPISTEERAARIEKARRLMREQRHDAMMLTGGTSLTYFTGMRWGLSERLFSMIVPAAGKPLLVTPAFEEDRAREQLESSPFGGDADVLTWHEDDDPYALVRQGLEQRGLVSGTLGVEETVRFGFSDGVAQAAPALTLKSATPVTAGCRTIKDAHELELMRIASAVTLRAFEAVYQSIEEGMTREDVGGLIRNAHSRLGYSGGALVLVDASTALPHGTVKPQTIREGSIILIDGGCGVEGYRSDISRTFVLGQPTDKMKTVFEIECRAQTAALEAARPGVACEEIDAAARRVIDAAGYGPDYAYFTHRVGHGIGMDGHEWPYLVRGNKLPLAPGMTFSDEPGIYLKDEFGVRLEDELVITEDGGRLLTPQSRSLTEPFAV
jgi:Xaa-Pro dipeptidase